MTNMREAILTAADLPFEEVDTPEWAPFGVPSVRVRGLSAAERDAWEMSLTQQDGKGRVQVGNLRNVRASFVAKIVVDEDGERVFTDRDARELGKRNAIVINRIWLMGRELSGMNEEEDGDENPSEGDQDEYSSSESPSPSESPTSIDSLND